MKRREFITLLGGAAVAWPLAARAQQAGMPVVGFLHTGSPESGAGRVAAFRKGLGEAGYVEGRNVAIEYRFAEENYDRLSELAVDLVRQRVAVIVTSSGSLAVRAAKASTTTIPIVFLGGFDPVEMGIVASLNRPGGNVTGLSTMSSELLPKRVGLLHELPEKTAPFAVLTDPRQPRREQTIADLEAAAHIIGRKIEIFYASTNREIDAAFAALAPKRPAGVLVNNNPLFVSRRVQVTTLATHHRVPAMYHSREFVEVGGLMSYGDSSTDQHRQGGIYVGRILKGEKPADLPVMRASRFEFVINLQTARIVGLDVPPILLALADEVIE
jgi:putative ABC transport system substrate-binding protein